MSANALIGARDPRCPSHGSALNRTASGQLFCLIGAHNVNALDNGVLVAAVTCRSCGREADGLTGARECADCREKRVAFLASQSPATDPRPLNPAGVVDWDKKCRSCGLPNDRPENDRQPICTGCEQVRLTGNSRDWGRA